jgi:hypothetical protein
MKLGDLKKSLQKFPPDMDDMEVMVAYTKDKVVRTYDPLCFTGYMPLPKYEFIVLGTLSEIQRMVKTGEIAKPDDFIEPDDEE